ncbi:TELO2-interacting protein 2-like isoform X1 [Neodiprion virginianus]|uniref:TELO2-interacting protein 2-like isoform X1 n=1 Tax=Neodiprion virginianus TaxID=2961670 RepID=UPI001EE6B216|nr:TELO2-interacting protein 2-like isoform X1 [Neodiprion virginianus]XP_046614101.1 TELO2-interacting protein 2-like isoform X1 [Neodiprion virginianus]XP_046614102.1 TELO2-interacting protein 2-like isoform X1 [Neodiprion virginianus]
MMNDLLRELESMKITGNTLNDDLLRSCVQLTEGTLVPCKKIGNERPCEEKDYSEYRQIVNRNLRIVEATFRHVATTFGEQNVRETASRSHPLRTYLINLIIIIGEQSEKNVWNTAESVSIVSSIQSYLCDLCKCRSMSELLVGKGGEGSSVDGSGVIEAVLLVLRPKLFKDTWKNYPAAVICYKWILWQVEEPNLVRHMNSIIPTALIILDDYVVENRLTGIKCIGKILQHAQMRKELVDTGYAEVIYDALKRLLIIREVAYIIPLYSCIRSLLSTLEYYNNTESLQQKTCPLQWTIRDDVILSLLSSMEFEQDAHLRHAYMSSLPGLLTNIGCAKWCERLTRILSEYCEHHTDLKTLKVTMEAAKTFLVIFQPRIPTHCVPLYAAFLKLHMDLIETPVFDKEIVQNLEDCIGLLYKSTPSIGKKIINDDRMKSVINQQLQFRILNDCTYFE